MKKPYYEIEKKIFAQYSYWSSPLSMCSKLEVSRHAVYCSTLGRDNLRTKEICVKTGTDNQATM